MAAITVITAIAVWVYYIPGFVHSRAFVPLLLFMSAVKFAIVVLFYMHLKYDHRLFRAQMHLQISLAAVAVVGRKIDAGNRHPGQLIIGQFRRSGNADCLAVQIGIVGGQPLQQLYAENCARRQQAGCAPARPQCHPAPH